MPRSSVSRMTTGRSGDGVRDRPRGSDADAAALIDHCKQSIASFKTPKKIHLVTDLPVDPQGKLLKRELRRLHGQVSA